MYGEKQKRKSEIPREQERGIKTKEQRTMRGRRQSSDTDIWIEQPQLS